MMRLFFLAVAAGAASASALTLKPVGSLRTVQYHDRGGPEAGLLPHDFYAPPSPPPSPPQDDAPASPSDDERDD